MEQINTKSIGVYKIELNGKCYVGSSSKSINARWNEHLGQLKKGTHDNSRLQNAFNKHGGESLIFSILETVETPEEVIILEQKYINELEPEYNICLVAGSSLGVKCSDEARIKISIAKLGFKHSKETIEKMSIAQKGRTHSEETKQNMKKSHQGVKKGPMSESQKQKISQALKGRNITEEVRQSRLGRVTSDETKLKMRLSHLKKIEP